MLAYQEVPSPEDEGCKDEDASWLCGHTRLDRIRNEVIGDKIGVIPIEDKMGEIRLRCSVISGGGVWMLQ